MKINVNKEYYSVNVGGKPVIADQRRHPSLHFCLVDDFIETSELRYEVIHSEESPVKGLRP